MLAVERPGWETRFWVNPPSLQSVTSVWHAHVVSKRRSSVE